MIKYIKGNILELYPKNSSSVIYIPHCCNDKKLIGSGIALGLAKKWPAVKEQNKSTTLGDVEFITCESNVIVANMIGQSGIVGPNNPKPIKYSSILKCMEKVKEHIKDTQSLNKVEIHTVKFGAKRAQGNWNLIEEFINECWGDLDITIYDLDI